MIKINFATHLPMVHGSPVIENISNERHKVLLSNKSNPRQTYSETLNPGQVYTSPFQYYIPWNVKVFDKEDKLVVDYDLNLGGQVVFIKMDAHALGDNLAWMPYVEVFRKKHNCRVICSTFWNDLFINAYPNIMFVKPNTRIDNIFAQYYIGTHDDTPPMYSPTTYLLEPLQKVACDILGLTYEDVKCEVNHKIVEKDPKKICLSQYASLDMKTWHGNWQRVVDFLVDKGYEVHVISKEPNKLQNVVDKSGDFPISKRIEDLASASYFIGVSSGLSWLAHSLDCHVFLISDFTPRNHEFKSNVTRIHGPYVRDKIKYEPVKQEVSTQDVIMKIKEKIK